MIADEALHHECTRGPADRCARSCSASSCGSSRSQWQPSPLGGGERLHGARAARRDRTGYLRGACTRCSPSSPSRPSRRVRLAHTAGDMVRPGAGRDHPGLLDHRRAVRRVPRGVRPGPLSDRGGGRLRCWSRGSRSSPASSVHLPRRALHRARPVTTGHSRALTGITAAVVGVIANLAVYFATSIPVRPHGRRRRIGPLHTALPDPTTLRPVTPALVVVGAAGVRRPRWPVLVLGVRGPGLAAGGRPARRLSTRAGLPARSGAPVEPQVVSVAGDAGSRTDRAANWNASATSAARWSLFGQGVDYAPAVPPASTRPASRNRPRC
ncbi:hypothetical protein HBB16_18965 [Pseudonocardia sp. MCCB 268]|nr:hypothetical protein [Pseudonocardia cytotoxica]